MNKNASEGSEEGISEFTEAEDNEKRFYFLQFKADIQTKPPSLSSVLVFFYRCLIGPNESYRQSGRSEMNYNNHSGRLKNKMAIVKVSGRKIIVCQRAFHF